MRSCNAGLTGATAPCDGGTSPSTMIRHRHGSVAARSATNTLAELCPTRTVSVLASMSVSRWEVHSFQAGGACWYARTSGTWVRYPSSRRWRAVGSKLDARTIGPGTRTNSMVMRLGRIASGGQEHRSYQMRAVRDDRSGSMVAVAGRQMAQPVYRHYTRAFGHLRFVPQADVPPAAFLLYWWLCAADWRIWPRGPS